MKAQTLTLTNIQSKTRTYEFACHYTSHTVKSLSCSGCIVSKINFQGAEKSALTAQLNKMGGNTK
jgi:hypothetical protein